MPRERDKYEPPATRCPKCNVPVCRAWTLDGKQVHLSRYKRRNGPYVITDVIGNRRIVNPRQGRLFYPTDTTYGYDLHDCEVAKYAEARFNR